MGGGSSKSSTQSNPVTTTVNPTATGTVGNVNQSYINLTAGAGASGGGGRNMPVPANTTVSITNSDADTVKAALDAATNAIANAVNFSQTTEAGAAALVSKAIGLNAAQTTGSTQGLGSAPASPTPVSGTSVSSPSFSDMLPYVAIGVALYFVFKRA